jgi:hypothetical protein
VRAPFDNAAERCYALVVSRYALSVLLLAGSFLGCAEEEPVPVALVLTPGQETDAFTRSPAPERIILHANSVEGASSQVLDARWPTGAFTLGSLDTNQMAAFEAEGRDPAGATVLRGATIFHVLWALDGTPLPVFMGRVGETSRPPGVLPFTHIGGLTTVVDARFIVSAGGTEALRDDGTASDPATFSVYDLGQWKASSATGTLSRNPRSLVTIQGRWALVIDDAGASWFDFATFESTDVTAPEGMTFSEVAGGRVLYGEEGEAYLVGPAREGSPSSAVLRVDWEGTLAVVRTGSERSGVAATYVAGRGLILVGGHDTEPGLLLLAPGSSTFSPLAYPADPVEGAAAAALPDERVVLAGGVVDGAPAPTRILDLRCTAQCETTDLGPTVGPLGVNHGWARATRTDEVLVVGADPTDASTKLTRIGGLLTTPFAEPVPLREPRSEAAPVALFGRAVAIVGGRKLEGTGVPSVEVYMPE